MVYTLLSNGERSRVWMMPDGKRRMQWEKVRTQGIYEADDHKPPKGTKEGSSV